MSDESGFTVSRPFDFSALEERANALVRDAWIKEAGETERAVLRLASRLLGHPIPQPTNAAEAQKIIADLRLAGYELTIEDNPPSYQGPGVMQVSSLTGHTRRVVAYKRTKVGEEAIPAVAFHVTNSTGDRI